MFVPSVPKEIDPKSLMKRQLEMLRLTTMWPLTAKTLLTKILAFFYSTWVVGCLTICTWGLLTKAVNTDDLVDRSEAMDIFTLTCSGAVKLLYFSYRHKEMENLVLLADKEFPRAPLFGDNPFHIDKWMAWCGPLSIIHCATAFFCISFWGACPILDLLFGMSPPEETPLPMNVHYPVDTTSSTPFFIFSYIFHYFGLISSTHVYMSCDGYFFSLIWFMIGQIRLLKVSLKGIDSVHPKGKENFERAREEALKKCILLHNNILAFLGALDRLFRTMIVADILHAIISLSFAMFQMSESKGITAMMKMVLFVAYCFLHQYLNSFFGQFLIDEQETLMAEAYGIDWSGRSKSFRKSLHIMMTGSLTPVRFSAWRMYFLQYETFVEFCRMMVSFFMVLRTIKYEK